MKNSSKFRSVCLCVAVLLISGCSTTNFSNQSKFGATIQRTSFGVPHITAQNLTGAAFGVAYVYAQDNFCLLADQLLTVSGERSKYLGPDVPVRAGLTLTNLKSDFVSKLLLEDATLAALYAQTSADAQQLVTGYVAGYNRFLRESGKNLPAACANAAWVRPMTSIDLLKLMHEKAIQGGYGTFYAGIYDAAPPAAVSAIDSLDSEAAAQQFASAWDERPDLGSNAYALGRDVTAHGGGMLLGNPHFPWTTTNRFYQFHLIVPGKLDVMGAALGGFPIPNIGFTNNVAWTHTVSTGRRFALSELTLQAGTRVIVDGTVQPLNKKTISIEVRKSDGSIETRSRDFYSSAHGPLIVGNGLTWTATKAFAIRDANADNARMLDQWLAIASAKNVGDIKASLLSHNGMPWVNTIAADRDGNAFYADISVTPYLTSARLAACISSPTAKAMAANRLFVLDGSKSSCAWETDTATGRQIYPPALLPALQRSDYLSNSNESAWLANPNQRNENLSPIIGANAKEQSMRTRMAFMQLRDRLNGADDKGGNKFSLANLESIYFNARSAAAELTVDRLIALCTETPRATATSGATIELAPACVALKNWDKRMTFTSRGVSVFREFWRRAMTIASLWATPFSAEDPINTPRDLNIENSTVRAALVKALADAVEKLAANNIAVDAALGDVQYTTSATGARIPIDGGDEFEGVFNKITPPAGLTAKGYTPILSGSTYIQLVRWDASGPIARGIITYSQSTDPASPHFADQTQRYSLGQWVTFPFKGSDIERDPALKTIEISE